MTLLRWDPWPQDVRELFRRGVDFPDTAFTPALDIVEREGDLLVRAEVPGVKPEDVDVSVHDGLLTVRGERKTNHTSEGETWLRRESSYGAFERRVSLPKETDPEAVTASYDNGVLTITVPKPAKAQPRRIDVSVENGPTPTAVEAAATEA